MLIAGIRQGYAGDLDKYILQFGQIHFAIWTNTFSNFDKYNAIQIISYSNIAAAFYRKSHHKLANWLDFVADKTGPIWNYNY